MEAVTSVLVERSRDIGGLSRMITASLTLHAVLLAALFLLPLFRHGGPEPDLQPVMTISLGGAAGPRAGGMTMMGRPIQTTAPLPAAARPAPVVRPPAAKTPEMVVPVPSDRPLKPQRSRPAESTAPSRAADIPPPAVPFGATGAAPAPSNPERGMGFGGLSTGGGAGAGGYLDVANFCCPDYLVTMTQLIQNNWRGKQEVSGETLITFRIQRDGRITDIDLERSSNYAALDIEAQRALFMTRRVPALPSAFPDNQLTVHLRFQYQR